MLKRLLAGGRQKELPAVQTLPSEAPPAAALDADAVSSHEGTAFLNEVITLLESDLRRAAAKMASAGSDMRSRVGDSAGVVQGIASDAQALAATTEGALERSRNLRQAFDGLSQASQQIERQASHSAGLADSAQTIAGEAARSIDELSKAIGEIERVVTVISEIAGQTNLLALNATIEAARAGAAGKGFAVVASEVKALSVETRNATAEIANTIKRLKDTAATNIDAVGRIIKSIDEIKPSFAMVRGAVDEQIQTTGDMGQSVDDSTRFAEEVAERARAMQAASGRAAEATSAVSKSSEFMDSAVRDVTQRLMMVLRQTPQCDRRRHERWPASFKGLMKAGSLLHKIETVDISLGGCLLKSHAESPPVGARIDLTLDGVSPLAGVVVAVSGLGVHVQFVEMTSSMRASVEARLAEVAIQYGIYIDRAKGGAAAVAEVMAHAVDRGELSLDALFDVDYKPIAGSSPVQVSNRALEVLDRILPPVQEPILATDASMVFCAAIDLNGYLPVHNRKYSHPQRAGDVAWNTANSRNRRIFDDRAGLLAARNARPYLVQVYQRDLGGGQLIMMKEIDAPIMVKGRHWGGFRTSYKL